MVLYVTHSERRKWGGKDCDWRSNIILYRIFLCVGRFLSCGWSWKSGKWQILYAGQWIIGFFFNVDGKIHTQYIEDLVVNLPRQASKQHTTYLVEYGVSLIHALLLPQVPWTAGNVGSRRLKIRARVLSVLISRTGPLVQQGINYLRYRIQARIYHSPGSCRADQLPGLSLLAHMSLVVGLYVRTWQSTAVTSKLLKRWFFLLFLNNMSSCFLW